MPNIVEALETHVYKTTVKRTADYSAVFNEDTGRLIINANTVTTQLPEKTVTTKIRIEGS